MATVAAASPSNLSRRKLSGKRPSSSVEEPGYNGPIEDPTPNNSKRFKSSEDGSKGKHGKEHDGLMVKEPGDLYSTDAAGNGTSVAKKVMVLNWTSEDLSHLVSKLSECLPPNDNVKYSTLIEKLDWEKVRFGVHSAAQCKEKWMQIMQRLRRFRTLTDMVTDAKEWLKHPWLSYASNKKQKHPEMPKKPLTPYFRYFLEKREKYSREHPEMSMTDLAKLLSKKFQEIPDKKKQKYKESYERENEVYKREMERFKREHPDEFPTNESKTTAVAHEGPEKPQTPLQLFIADRLKKPEYTKLDKKEALDLIRKQWATLSDGKRIKWIRKAVQDQQRYELTLAAPFSTEKSKDEVNNSDVQHSDQEQHNSLFEPMFELEAPQSVESAEPLPKKHKPRSKLAQIAATARELKALTQSVAPAEPNECDAFAKHIAIQLKKLSQPQCVLAQGEIQRVLTHYRMSDYKCTNCSFNSGSSLDGTPSPVMPSNLETQCTSLDPSTVTILDLRQNKETSDVSLQSLFSKLSGGSQ